MKQTLDKLYRQRRSELDSNSIISICLSEGVCFVILSLCIQYLIPDIYVYIYIATLVTPLLFHEAVKTKLSAWKKMVPQIDELTSVINTFCCMQKSMTASLIFKMINHNSKIKYSICLIIVLGNEDDFFELNDL